MGRWKAWSQLRQLKASMRPSFCPSTRPFSASLERFPRLQRHGFYSPFFRFFSTIPAVSDSYDGGFGSGHHEYIQRNEWDSHEDEGTSRYIPVKAYFISTSIDLKSMQTENVYYVIPPSSRSSNYVVLRYSDYPLDIGINESGDNCRYVVVFQYGSAVLFNIADHEAEQYLDIVRKHAHGLLPDMRKDDYAVVEKPQLTSWMHGGSDYIALKSLDMDGIRIICNVLGQSIALDHYIGQVDDMVKEFTDINRGMEKTGTFTMKRKKLFQLVGKANSNLADVIIKLGLFDRSEIAWKNANYAQILEYLREEYELAQRFGSLNFKLKFVEVGRYKSPDEHPFFPADLPEPMLPPMQYPKVLHHAADSININKTIWQMYFSSLLPRLVKSGNDGNCGSSSVCDTICLQSLSKRIHYGKFVAEAKFMENPDKYQTAIKAQDRDKLMSMLTYESVETIIKERVETKAKIFGQKVTVGSHESEDPPEFKICPGLVAELYGKWIMPLTKEVQVEYLLRRLD